MECNIKLCCQCKHNIVGIDNQTQYWRCQKRGFKFEKFEEPEEEKPLYGDEKDTKI